MSNTNENPATADHIVPTKEELKLIAHVRNWGAKELCRTLRFAEARTAYHTPSLTEDQRSGLWLMSLLARRIKKCGKRKRAHMA